MKALRLLLSSALVGGVLALTPTANYGGGCVLLDTTIYCYAGGYYVGAQTGVNTMSSIVSLDLSSNFTVSTAGGSWNEVTPTTNVLSEPNFLFSMVAIPSKHCFVVNGGLGVNNGTPLKYQTMSFDVSTKSWTNIDSSNQPQTRQASMILGNGDKIYLWGGNSDDGTGAANETFPSDMRILDFKMGTWSFVPHLNESFNRIEHSAALSSDGKMIYYVGGLTGTRYIDTSNTVQYTLDGIEMSSITTFDTSTSQWGSVTTSSIAIPTQRRLHTSGTIPGTNTLLLYGGAQLSESIPVSDYCYTLDLNTLQWTQIVIPEGGPGPRYGHSMVFSGNSSLFIIFGIVSDGRPTSDFGVLDISSWTLVENFTGLVSPPDESTNSTDTITNPNEEGSKANTGAIAGGVVGGVLGIALIAGALIFFMRRKRQAPPRELEGVNAKTMDNHGEYPGQQVLPSANTETTYYKGFSPATMGNPQSPLFSTTGSAEEFASTSSPTAVNRSDIFFAPSKMVMQPVKPDGQ